MRIAISCLAVVLALPILAQAVSAQAGLREGVKVRIYAAGEPRVTGVVQSVTQDSLVVLAEPGATSFAIARSAISELEVSRGRSRAAGAKRGARWGALGGLAGALAVMVTAGEEPDAPSPVAIAVLVVAEYAGVGALIGALVKAEQWDAVNVRPSIAYGHGGITLGFVVR
jgi:hypothetical protein